MTTTAGGEPPHVCVVGAGVCGLVSIKACLEAGLRVTCFDRSSRFGGLWNYSPTTSCESQAHHLDSGQPTFEPSVMRTTILNTGKELSSFSDFPPPATLANFMRHDLYMDYIRSYAEHNKLAGHIRLRHEIVHVEPQLLRRPQPTANGSPAANGRASRAAIGGAAAADAEQALVATQVKWLIGVRNLVTGELARLEFDRLMFAVGHHNVPYEPELVGQDQFGSAKVIHSARFKDILTDERVLNKRVLVVGLGNSACDAAADLALVARKCYVSCHRGNWFINRLSADNFYDLKQKTRLNSWLVRLAPAALVDQLAIRRLESRTNHAWLGLTPLHKPSEHVPTINDLFPYRVLTGGIVLKSSLLALTQRGARFEGEPDAEYELDLVILATGYRSEISFLDERALGLKSESSNAYQLYLNMFAPHLRPPATDGARATSWTPANERERAQLVESMAFIGHVQPAGSITVVSELQARYAAQIFAGRLHLPSRDRMLKQMDKIERTRSRAIRSHSRDQIIGDWVAYLDLVGARLGAKPNLTKLFFSDFQLWRRLVFGPSVPYQYRLGGPHSWPKAREAVMTVDERVYQGVNEGKNHLLFETRRKCLIGGSLSAPKTALATTTRNDEKKLQ